MNQKMFSLMLYLLAILKIPLSYFLRLLKIFIPMVESRIKFESKNIGDNYSTSFLKLGLRANFCFEVSSEGELEQIMPLVERFLLDGKRLEIIFASPSVESKCIKLAQTFPEHIRLLRFPILMGTFFNLSGFQNLDTWISAPLICFCRYDFYPELLLLCKGRKAVLLAASSKRNNFYKKLVYRQFDFIVCSNKNEETFFTDLKLKAKIQSCDFRILRIVNRIDLKEHSLCNFQTLQSFLTFIKNQNNSFNLIIGSAWRSDLVHLDSKFVDLVTSKKAHLLVVPHDLKKHSIIEMKHAFSIQFPGIRLYEINSTESQFDEFLYSNKPGIVFLNMSGVLCELYSFFDYAYVGGGHEFSIHSVLEPYLAGAKVLTSGNVSRSTEYDFIKENAPDEIYLLNNDQTFYNFFMTNKLADSGKNVRAQIIGQSQDMFSSIVKEFYE